MKAMMCLNSYSLFLIVDGDLYWWGSTVCHSIQPTGASEELRFEHDQLQEFANSPARPSRHRQQHHGVEQLGRCLSLRCASQVRSAAPAFALIDQHEVNLLGLLLHQRHQLIRSVTGVGVMGGLIVEVFSDGEHPSQDLQLEHFGRRDSLANAKYVWAALAHQEHFRDVHRQEQYARA